MHAGSLASGPLALSTYQLPTLLASAWYAQSAGQYRFTLSLQYRNDSFLPWFRQRTYPLNYLDPILSYCTMLHGFQTSHQSSCMMSQALLPGMLSQRRTVHRQTALYQHHNKQSHITTLVRQIQPHPRPLLHQLTTSQHSYGSWHRSRHLPTCQQHRTYSVSSDGNSAGPHDTPLGVPAAEQSAVKDGNSSASHLTEQKQPDLQPADREAQGSQLQTPNSNHSTHSEHDGNHGSHDDGPHGHGGHGHGAHGGAHGAAHQLQHRAVEKSTFKFLEKVAERMSEKVGERVTERLAERAGERVAERAGERLLERAGERALERAGERALERAGERAVERAGERALERAGERALERAGERAMERAGERALERAGERALERAGERAMERAGERALERAGERALERAGERAMERAGERALERAGERAMERAGERALERAGERAIERAGERALERVGERAIERAGERALERAGERAMERAGERALERAGERAVERAGGRAMRRAGERAVERAGERALERTGEHALERASEVAAERAAERLFEHAGERAFERAGESVLERAGERSISPLLRAGEAAAERAAERVAQHGTEALAAHAGDVAVVAGVIHAGRSSSRGLTGLLDKMVDNLLASRFLRRFVSPAVMSRIGRGALVGLPAIGALFVAHLAHQDWDRLQEERAAGNKWSAVSFAVAFLGDLLDVAAHVVVVTGLLHTHFQVGLHVDHHLLHLVEGGGLAVAAVGTVAAALGEILAVRALRKVEMAKERARIDAAAAAAVDALEMAERQPQAPAHGTAGDYEARTAAEDGHGWRWDEGLEKGGSSGQNGKQKDVTTLQQQ